MAASDVERVLAAVIRFLDVDGAFGPLDARTLAAKRELQAVIAASVHDEKMVDIAGPTLVVLEGGLSAAR